VFIFVYNILTRVNIIWKSNGGCKEVENIILSIVTPIAWINESH